MTDYVAKPSEKRKASGPRYSIIPGAFCYDERPGIWHFRVLNLLGRHTDRDGWCVRSQTAMAEDINTTRETVNRTIRDLCEWGYVQKTDQGSDRRSVCFYRVIMDPPGQPDVNEMACDEPITSDDSITGGCDGTDHRGVTGTITGGVITAITPITTPLKRPILNDLEREGASAKDARPPRAKAPVSITLKVGETAFAAWLDHLRQQGLGQMADDARDEGFIEVPQRWPDADSKLLRPPTHRRSGLSDVSKRMVGESAK